MLITMHLSQVLTVFWLVVAAAQYGSAFDAFGGADGLARGAAAATAGVAGASAGVLGVQKGLLVKEALIKLIKAKLAATGVIGNEVVKGVASEKAYANKGYAHKGYANKGYANYAPVAPVAAVPVVAPVAPVQEVTYERGYKDDNAAGVAAAAKTKGLLALLASLALAKEGIRKANSATVVEGPTYAAAPAYAAAPVYAAAPIAGTVAPGIIGTPDTLDGQPVMSLQAPVGVRIEGGKHISNKAEIVGDKGLTIAGEKILKGLLVKLGIVSAGAAADALVTKLALTADAEILPLFLAAALLDERGWVPDAFVKDGVSLWGQLLPNFSESAKGRIFNDILI